jgi:hypothetical protein
MPFDLSKMMMLGSPAHLNPTSSVIIPSASTSMDERLSDALMDSSGATEPSVSSNTCQQHRE